MGNRELDELLAETGEDDLIVGGFQFDSTADAQNAQREQQNIETLKSRIDLTNEENMLALYCKLAEKRVFHTPIGFQFLGEFREFLVDELNMDGKELPLIYVAPSRGLPYSQMKQLEFLQNENRRISEHGRRYQITIGVLIAMIVAMFLITLFNPNVGYINTENKILNRYAGWEEDLTRREAQIREKEAELGISSPISTESGSSME